VGDDLLVLMESFLDLYIVLESLYYGYLRPTAVWSSRGPLQVNFESNITALFSKSDFKFEGMCCTSFFAHHTHQCASQCIHVSSLKAPR